MPFSSDDARSPHHHTSWRSCRADAFEENVVYFGNRGYLLENENFVEPDDGSDSDITKRCMDNILNIQLQKVGKVIQRMAEYFKFGQKETI